MPNISPPLFLKSSAMESWKSRIRMTLGLERKRKHGGGYDWAVEELFNTLHANQQGIPTAQVLGFGYRRHPLGWIDEFFLLSEQLENHINGQEWLRRSDCAPSEFVGRALQLIVHLHQKGLIHLDPWAANFMVNPADPQDLRIIDLENCIRQPAIHLQETLAIQFGILFRRETSIHISEESFDQQVMRVLAEQGLPYDKRFHDAYQVAKHQKIARKARRKTPQLGAVLPG
jgi:tRNA A-37 threonylcarbamoyl transferase component Bud32